MKLTMIRAMTLLAAMAMAFASAAATPSLEVKLPSGTKISSGVAVAPDLDLRTQGTVSGTSVRFDKLLPRTPYNVILTLDDGTVLEGVNMGWYMMQRNPPKADPLGDEDRAAIREIFDGIKAFENKRNMLLINGDSAQVTVLAELIRDSAFHSGSGREVIWRIELWYFKNEHGGWEKVQQQNQVLHRERFKTHAAYEAGVKKFRWIPALGGFTLNKDETLRTVEVDPSKKSPMANVPPATKSE